MKRIILSYVIILFGVLQTNAQCNPYYTFADGALWELTSYDAKGKIQGRQVNTIAEYEKMSDGWEAVINFENYDKKGELALSGDVNAACSNGIVKVDMQRFVSQESLQAFKDMEMEFEYDNLELPSHLEPGQTLDDGSILITGNLPFEMSISITNRKVEGKEKIITPLGTFDCYKISYTIKTKTIIGLETQGIDYITEDYGVIKTETYKKNGKLSGYSILTKVE